MAKQKKHPDEVDGYIPDIHYSKSLEEGLLGACLQEKNALGRIQGLVRDRKVFYFQGHQVVYDAMVHMWHRNFPIDILTVVNDMAVRNIEIPNGENLALFVTRLTNSVISSANIEVHALILRQKHCLRELDRLLKRPVPTDIDPLQQIAELQKELAVLVQVQVTDDWSNMVDNTYELLGHMAKVKGRPIIGLPSGFSKLDLMNGGFMPGTVTVLAARPSVGKSAVMACMAVFLATLPDPITSGIVSLEMPKVQQTARIAANVCDTEFWRIYRNNFKDDLQEQKVKEILGDVVANLTIYISDRVGVDINDIRAKIIYLVQKYGAKIVFIDYLQLVEGHEVGKNSNREQIIAQISRGVKVLAMELGIHIVLLSQLNRAAATVKDGVPRLEHLRESGAIEQDADNVIFLDRPFMRGELFDAAGNSTEKQAKLIIAKWRNGSLGEIPIHFEPERMVFMDIAPEFSFSRTG